MKKLKLFEQCVFLNALNWSVVHVYFSEINIENEFFDDAMHSVTDKYLCKQW